MMDYETVDSKILGRSLHGFGTNLLVRNVIEEADFLVKVFGIKAHQVSADFAILIHDGDILQLHSDAAYGAHPLLGILPESTPRGAGAEIRLFGIDPDEAAKTANELGATVLQDPMDKPHGLRECYIMCKNGYIWVPSVPDASALPLENTVREKTLLSIGHGYSAQALGKRLQKQGWDIYATTRSEEKVAQFELDELIPVLWPDDSLEEALSQASHILISVGPDEEGDPILRKIKNEIINIAPQLTWVGYLSTTGVYGDYDGDWVDETSELLPATDRGIARMKAEAEWQAIPDLPLHIFRLAGIYGPGRGPFQKVLSGNARRIIKGKQVFNRIHVDDIVQVLEASIQHPNPGAIYNVCDDEAAPPQDVIAYAAEILGLPIPPVVAFDEVELSSMTRSFYAENKRVRNDLIKDELGIKLRYPNYRSGLNALLDADEVKGGLSTRPRL